MSYLYTSARMYQYKIKSRKFECARRWRVWVHYARSSDVLHRHVASLRVLTHQGLLGVGVGPTTGLVYCATVCILPAAIRTFTGHRFQHLAVEWYYVAIKPIRAIHYTIHSRVVKYTAGLFHSLFCLPASKMYTR